MEARTNGPRRPLLVLRYYLENRLAWYNCERSTAIPGRGGQIVLTQVRAIFIVRWSRFIGMKIVQR